MLVRLEKETDVERFICPRDDRKETVGYCRNTNCKLFNGYKTTEEDGNDIRNILCDYNYNK